MTDNCHHIWEPAIVLRTEPCRFCPKCNYWEQITRAHFKELFGQSFWSWVKFYSDKNVAGGYKAYKRLMLSYKNV